MSSSDSLADEQHATEAMKSSGGGLSGISEPGISPRHQIPLSVSTPFSYRAGDFVLHDGVRAIAEGIADLADELASNQPARFRAAIVLGAPRSGKTHLGIFVADTLAQTGFLPMFRSGSDLRPIDNEALLTQRVVVVLDEAERLLDLADSDAGRFVSLYEQVRQACGVLLCLTREPLRAGNPHLESRFASSLGFLIEDPARSEVAAVIQAMARQRGLRLSSRNAAFIERRLGNHIQQLEEYLDRVLKLSQTRPGAVGMELLRDAL